MEGKISLALLFRNSYIIEQKCTINANSKRGLVMCGRFNLWFFPQAEDLFEETFGIPYPRLVYPPILGKNILPFRDITAIHRERDGELVSRPMFWNLIPGYEKEFKPSHTWFNIRKEKLEQPYSRSLVKRKRCIVPVNSFIENKKLFGRPVYQTKKIGGKSIRKKESYEFTEKDQRLMALGGIYDVWKENGPGEKYSCSIITLEPNSLVGEIHDRMPFILPKKAVKIWLDKSVDDFDFLFELIRPYPPDKMDRKQQWPENSGQQGLF